jgi:hypothetical protein
MALIRKISVSDLVQKFKDYDRADNFSNEAIEALYDYLEDLSSDTKQNIELDVIALCCEWSECTLEELVTNYSEYEYLKHRRSGEAFIINLDDECFVSKEDFLEEIRDSHQLIEVNNGQSYLING